jgi:hypothetical protein
MTGDSRVRRFVVELVALAGLLCGPPSIAQESPAAASTDAVAGDVVLYALGFIGVPYRWGGDDPSRGFDCSGFVRHVYRGVPGVDLPRTSEAMSRSGRRIDRAALGPGDLVFFNTLGRAWTHVGIYLGDGRFVHAPARRGQVRIEGLDDPYWRARYSGARRLIAGDPSGEPPSAVTRANAPASSRAAPATSATEDAMAGGRSPSVGPLGDGP